MFPKDIGLEIERERDVIVDLTKNIRALNNEIDITLKTHARRMVDMKNDSALLERERKEHLEKLVKLLKEASSEMKSLVCSVDVFHPDLQLGSLLDDLIRRIRIQAESESSKIR